MTHRQAVLHPRRIPLEGPVNFRDLGGYCSVDGRTVRWRRVFRADGLETMTPQDVRHVVEDLGVSKVIDLRTPRELELVGVGLLEHTPVEWHNISIIDETLTAWQHALEQGSVVEMYMVMLEGSSARFVEALEIIAAAESPLVFHCAAGKDRTGLLAALVLSVLGVDDDSIADDYGLSSEVLPELRRRWEERAAQPEFRAKFGPARVQRAAGDRQMTADPSTLLHVLRELRSRFGSPEAWLVAHGLAPEAVNVLRSRLLV